MAIAVERFYLAEGGSGSLQQRIRAMVADGILKLLLNLQAQEGVAYLFITHDLATVRAIADKIAVM